MNKANTSKSAVVNFINLILIFFSNFIKAFFNMGPPQETAFNVSGKLTIKKNVNRRVN